MHLTRLLDSMAPSSKDRYKSRLPLLSSATTVNPTIAEIRMAKQRPSKSIDVRPTYVNNVKDNARDRVTGELYPRRRRLPSHVAKSGGSSHQVTGLSDKTGRSACPLPVTPANKLKWSLPRPRHSCCRVKDGRAPSVAAIECAADKARTFPKIILYPHELLYFWASQCRIYLCHRALIHSVHAIVRSFL